MNPLALAGGECQSAIAIFPEVTRQERYDAALKFSQDPTYYPEYIKDRVNKYVIERLIDNTTDKPATFTFFSFTRLFRSSKLFL